MFTETDHAIADAVYHEHMRAYHEYMDTPWYFFRFWKNSRKNRLGYYVDGLNDWGTRLERKYRELCQSS